MNLRHTVAAAAVLCSFLAQAETYPARVVGVHDGDTVTVLDGTRAQHKIRLAGIDAPELRQPFGQRARQYLADQVFSRDVVLDCGKMDWRNKREVCVILLAGQDINLQQVEAGLAWWYRAYSRDQTPAQRKDYAAAETEARETRLGLWADDNPVPPWEWRHRGRRAPTRELQ